MLVSVFVRMLEWNAKLHLVFAYIYPVNSANTNSTNDCITIGIVHKVMSARYFPPMYTLIKNDICIVRYSIVLYSQSILYLKYEIIKKNTPHIAHK